MGHNLTPHDLGKHKYNLVSNTNYVFIVLDEREAEPVSSMVPLSVSSALKFFGAPSMLLYYTPTLPKLSSSLEQSASHISHHTVNALPSTITKVKSKVLIRGMQHIV